MKKLFSTMSIILTLSIFCAALYGQESAMLKYNFKEGKTFRTTTTVTTSTVQSMMGQEMKVLADVSLSSDLKFIKVDNQGNATSLISVQGSSSVTVPTGGEPMVKKEDFKNNNISVVFSPDGKSISEKLIDSEGKDASTVKNYIKLTQLPKRIVKSGEIWQDKQVDTISSPEGGANPITFMTTATDTKYTFVGKEQKDGKELYRISYTGTLDIAGKGNQMGMDLVMEGSGVTKGFFYFDPALSIVVYNDGVTEMNTTISVTGQQNMTIPMTQSVKVVAKTEAI